MVRARTILLANSVVQTVVNRSLIIIQEPYIIVLFKLCYPYALPGTNEVISNRPWCLISESKTYQSLYKLMSFWVFMDSDNVTKMYAVYNCGCYPIWRGCHGSWHLFDRCYANIVLIPFKQTIVGTALALWKINYNRWRVWATKTFQQVYSASVVIAFNI